MYYSVEDNKPPVADAGKDKVTYSRLVVPCVFNCKSCAIK